jgi:hypothetical protein
MTDVNRVAETLKAMETDELEERYRKGMFTDETKGLMERELKLRNRRQSTVRASIGNRRSEAVDSTAAKVRSNSIKGATSAVIIGLIVVAFCTYYTRNTVRLALYGKDIVATVRSYEAVKCGPRRARGSRICHAHDLVGGGNYFRLTLPQAHAVGTEVQLVYLPADPSLVRSGFVGASPLGYIWQNLSGAIGVGFALGLLMIGRGVVLFRASVNPGTA